MDVYLAFTDKENAKIEQWKKELPKVKKGAKRSYGISFHPMNEKDEDDHLLFKAYFTTDDGHRLFLTKKAAFH
jgi:hypothetical protein